MTTHDDAPAEAAGNLGKSTQKETVAEADSSFHPLQVDGRWLHSEEVEALPTMGSGPYHARFQQTMLRIKARSLCFLLGGGWATR